MSAIIDDKVVAGAQSANVVKEDPIVALTVHTVSNSRFMRLIVLPILSSRFVENNLTLSPSRQ